MGVDWENCTRIGASEASGACWGAEGSPQNPEAGDHDFEVPNQSVRNRDLKIHCVSSVKESKFRVWHIFKPL